jgi:RNA polymerase sigma-70 factor (ECF subfamily)
VSDPRVAPVSAASDGDFAPLFAESRDRLFRFALRLTRDPAEAEDLVQDSMLTAWRKRSLYDGRGSFGGFLRRTALRLFLNERVRQRRRGTLEVEGFAPLRHAAEAAPDMLARQDALEYFVARTGEALQSLPPEQREAFMLFRFEGLTCAEIAERSGTPVKTVETRVRRATLALAEALREHRALLLETAP